MSIPSTLTPQDRLALSRKAIVKHMNRHHRDHALETGYEADEADRSESFRRGPWNALKQAVRAWWFRHPASSALELARPLLDDYARAHPFKLLGAAAGVGAAAALIRPWRMVSVGGLLLAAVKSSGLSGALLSLLTSRSQTSRNHQEAP
ncbi:MAG: hypothetical protein ABIV07_07465 [Polaromonas sp.]